MATEIRIGAITIGVPETLTLETLARMLEPVQREYLDLFEVAGRTAAQQSARCMAFDKKYDGDVIRKAVDGMVRLRLLKRSIGITRTRLGVQVYRILLALDRRPTVPDLPAQTG